MESRDSLSITYTLVPDDIVVFLRYCATTDPKSKRSYWTSLGQIILAVVIINLIYTNFDLSWSSWQFALGAIVICCMLYPFNYRFQINRAIREMTKKQSVEGVVGTHTIRLEADGIYEKTAVNESHHLIA